MSSYLLIRIINKKKYEEYLNKYSEFEKLEKSYYDDSWSEVHKIIKDNSFVLMWSSRSSCLYQTFQKAMGYTSKSLTINSDGLQEAIAMLNKDYDYYKSELDYYNKNGFFKREITSKRIEDALSYLESIKKLVNEEKIDDIKMIVSKTKSEESDYQLYQEYVEELDDIDYAKTFTNALLIILEHIDDDVVLIYDMD